MNFLVFYQTFACMPEAIHIPGERIFSLCDTGSSMPAGRKEKRAQVEQITQCANDYMKTPEDMEADFRISPYPMQPALKSDHYPFASTFDNLDGYIDNDKPGIEYAGFMEENY